VSSTRCERTDDLCITIAGKSSSGWVHLNHSFSRAFDLHVIVDTAKRLKLRVGQGWIQEPPLHQVCSLNIKARLLGMSYGMTRVEVDTFSQPTVLSRSLQSEAAAKDILLECAGAFSPRIEDRSEDTALLFGVDLAGTQSLFRHSRRQSLDRPSLCLGPCLCPRPALRSNPESLLASLFSLLEEAADFRSCSYL
jgi:hypothetical protein